MNRTQILERLAELDRQINAQVHQGRVPNLNLKHRSFPLSAWITVVVFFGLWVFGPNFHSLLEDYNIVMFILTVLFGIFALYRTVMWLIKGRVKVDKNYAKNMDAVMHLQKEREDLRKKLEESE